MNEKPLEWMTACGESIGHKLGRIITIAAAVVMLLFYMMSGQLFAVLGMMIFGALFAWMQLHAYVEYEFCYFGDEVDVAVIYNRARRKNKMNFLMADVEYMVKKVEPQGDTKYFCNRKAQGNIYTIVLNQNGKRSSVVLEAEPEFVKAMEMRRKVR